MHQETLCLGSGRPGLHNVTRDVARVVEKAQIDVGLCSVFVQHTSASLLIQENADPSARADLERYFELLAPEGEPWYTHTAEGPDDMPAHLRAALTNTSEQIPVTGGRLALGTWQGLYLFEHRRRSSDRRLVVTVWGE
jgi:secondary thiamine-phosphate synthase enzyme